MDPKEAEKLLLLVLFLFFFFFFFFFFILLLGNTRVQNIRVKQLGIGPHVYPAVQIPHKREKALRRCGGRSRVQERMTARDDGSVRQGLALCRVARRAEPREGRLHVLPGPEA
jgi:hypothetical protein